MDQRVNQLDAVYFIVPFFSRELNFAKMDGHILRDFIFANWPKNMLKQ